MLQLTGISLENFRVFKDRQDFEFSPITILTGTNNSGKSSLLKALLLLNDTVNDKENLLEQLNFRGTSHNLGSFKNAKCKYEQDKSKGIDFWIKVRSENDADLAWIPGLFFGLAKKEIEIHLHYDTRNRLRKFEIHSDKHLVLKKQFRGGYILYLSKLFPIGFNIHGDDDDYYSSSKEYYYQSFVDIFDIEKLFKILQNHEDKTDKIRSKLICDKIEAKIKKIDHLEVVSEEILYPFEKNLLELLGYKQGRYNQEADEFEWIAGKLKLLNEDEEFILSDIYLKDIFNEECVGHRLSDHYGTEREYSDLKKYITREFSSFFEDLSELLKFNHSETIRAHSNRIYNFNDDKTSFNKLLTQFSEFDSQKFQDSKFRNFLQKWLKEFNIGEKISINEIKGIANEIIIKSRIGDIDLIDLGYGFTQFLPILMKISSLYQLKHHKESRLLKRNLDSQTTDRAARVNLNKIQSSLSPEEQSLFDFLFEKSSLDQGEQFIIDFLFEKSRESEIQFINNPDFKVDFLNGPFLLLEEPETNLHPKLQSKIADMLIDAIDTFNIRFIIETHSEYLIRKLQYWVAKKKLTPKDVAIYYFYPYSEVPEGRKQIEKINILEDGSLDNDFGAGFFDEAINLKFDLLRLKSKKK